MFYYIRTVLILACVCSMSSQASQNSQEEKEKEYDAKVKKIRAELRASLDKLKKLSREMKDDTPLYKVIKELQQLTLLNRQYSGLKVLQNEMSVLNNINKNLMPRITKNRKGITDLKKIVGKLREKIGVAEAMTTMNPRKRRRTLLKL